MENNRETESFFWNRFTDTYIEMVKARAWGEGSNESVRGSAVASLRQGLNVLLRLFAPILPYITEEVWSWVFAEDMGIKSIHKAEWPTESEFAGVGEPKIFGIFELAVAGLAAINRSKAEAGISSGRPFDHLTIATVNSRTANTLKSVISDLIAAARTRSYSVEVADDLEDNSIQICEARFAQAL